MRKCSIQLPASLPMNPRSMAVPSSSLIDLTRWRFGGVELARARRIRRLQRDFEANLQSVAVMLDLMDEIDRLRAVLQRAGLPG